MGYCRELLCLNIDAFTQARTVIEGVEMVCTYKPTEDSSLFKNKSKVQNKFPSSEALFLGKSDL